MKSFGVFLLIASLALDVCGCARSNNAYKPRHLCHAKARALAERIVEKTSEHARDIYSGEGSNWVLLSENVKDNPPALQRQVIKLMKAKYKVYLHIADVPKDAKVLNEAGTLTGLRKGFIFFYNATWLERGTVEVHYASYGGITNRSYVDKYVWEHGEWKLLSKKSSN